MSVGGWLHFRGVGGGSAACRARPWRPGLAVACLAVVWCCVAVEVRAQPPSTTDDPQFARVRLGEATEAEVLHRYFRDLRRRGLFSLAELEAMRRLDDPQLAEGLVVELTIELTETFAAHAVERPPAEAAELWRRADQQIEELSRKFATHPRRLLIDVQRGRLHYLHALADLLTHELRVPPEEWSERPEPVQRLIAVIGELESLLRQAQQQRAASDGEQGLSPDALRDVRESLTLWIGSAYCELCLHATRGRYPAISSLFRDIARATSATQGFAPQRIQAWAAAGLNRLRELDERGAAASAADREATWRRAQILRVTGKLDEARALLKSLWAAAGDDELAQRVAAELARTAVARGEVLDAADELLEARRRLGNGSAELHYLNGVVLFELAAVAGRAGRREAAAEAEVQARAHLERALRAGGFWGQWAQRELRRREAEAQLGPELAALIERAEWLQRQQRYGEAIETYAAAAVAAYRQQRRDAAFDAAYRRASLLYALRRWKEAHVAFAELAERFSEHPRAPAAGLLAADSLIRHQREVADLPDQQIERFFGELVRRFQGRPELYEVRRLMARWHESRERPLSALVQYERILAAAQTATTPAAERRTTDGAAQPQRPWQVIAAVAGVARCYERVMALAPDAARVEASANWSPDHVVGDSVDDAHLIASLSGSQWASRAVDRLEELIEHFEPSMERTTDVRAVLPWLEALLRLARLYLTQNPPDHTRAGGLLYRALQRAERMAPDVRDDRARKTLEQLTRAARQLLVVSLAGRGRIDEARELLRQIAASDTEHLLSVIDGLMAAGRSASPEVRRRLADLQLMAASALIGEQAESVGATGIPWQRRELTDAQKVRVYAAIVEAFVVTNQPRRAVAAARAALRLAPQDTALQRRFAELFVECGTPECLDEALILWRRLEVLAPDGSRDFLQARYFIMRCLAGLGRMEEARKLARVTRLLYESDQHADLWQRIRQFESSDRTP